MTGGWRIRGVLVQIVTEPGPVTQTKRDGVTGARLRCATVSETLLLRPTADVTPISESGGSEMIVAAN